MRKNDRKDFGQIKKGAGCGSCPPSKCVAGGLMASFTPDVTMKVGQLAERLNQFCKLCKSKATNGKMSIDAEVKEGLVEIQGAIGELQGENSSFPELQKAIVHVLMKHGNQVTSQVFLKQK